MKEGKQYVWEGAIPLQINLEESEVTTVPGPPPALLLAPRIGYLPLLYPLLKPHFSSYLPSLSSNNNNNSIWFDFNGLPLKWYIPTGVLFDLLCPSPQRPWNLTVHFSGYPTDLLIPCDGEDSVKWNFINSLKEADYIANGNCKNVMNMSQSDQVELWRSVLNCNLEAYLRASSKLKLGSFDDEFSLNMNGLLSELPRKPAGESAQTKTGKIPVRLYVYKVSEDFEDWEDVPTIDCWDKVSYFNRPIEVQREEGKLFTLHDALRALLPEHFGHNLVHEHSSISSSEGGQSALPKDGGRDTKTEGGNEILTATSCAEILLVRIQGIEPRLEIPMGWVVKNLKHPEHYLHICVWIKC